MTSKKTSSELEKSMKVEINWDLLGKIISDLDLKLMNGEIEMLSDEEVDDINEVLQEIVNRSCQIADTAWLAKERYRNK